MFSYFIVLYALENCVKLGIYFMFKCFVPKPMYDMLCFTCFVPEPMYDMICLSVLDRFETFPYGITMENYGITTENQ